MKIISLQTPLVEKQRPNLPLFSSCVMDSDFGASAECSSSSNAYQQ
ncbi:hypothetical protein T08_15567 [Trichinella sp. T8]|nr:hypothetical protein T08_13321 [Trichinella sp. T8]KRZ81725.1 hypothetical protein T08_15567 [Trichinella sp. T8]